MPLGTIEEVNAALAAGEITQEKADQLIAGLGGVTTNGHNTPIEPV